MSSSPQTTAAKALFSYRPYWAKRYGTAPFLPMTRAEMDQLGWDSCDVILVSGDAYVDHPSFGMAVIGRTLEAQGFRVGIIAQPDWRKSEDFSRLGAPNLFFGVTSGNMDSMVNRYTADRKIRSNDAYSPGGRGNTRPDRASIVYSQRCKESFRHVPVILGGIEASLRRIAHYDYWSDKIRRSILLDAKADLLVFGNGERQIVEISHRLAAGEAISAITDIAGTAFKRKQLPEDWTGLDLSELDVTVHAHEAKPNPYLEPGTQAVTEQGAQLVRLAKSKDEDKSKPERQRTVLIMPSYEAVRADPLLYAHASRILHRETNPGNARCLYQAHGDSGVWFNPPPQPLSTPELDQVFELPYRRVPHPQYQDETIPAYEMIRFSINIMRGCFGGCTFATL